MSRRIKIGDIIEIPTKKGLSYIQYSNHHEDFGSLVRVLPGFFREQPKNFSLLVNAPEYYVTFFPLSVALSRNIFKKVANYDMPESAKKFPIFRDGIIDPISKKVKVWWFWDGTKEWKVGNISKEERKFPIRGIWNDTLLVERIESGWTPETDNE